MKQKRSREARGKRIAGVSITRRDMLAGATFTGAALAGGLIPATAIQAAPQAAAAATKPVTAFSPEQRRILEAFADRIIPTDENGPGAVESGAAEYIDRSFVDFLAAEKESFATGLANLDAFARTSQGAPFAQLSTEKRDAVLTAIDNDQAPNLKAFFARARRLTLEGMFCDPYWGGNKNFAGWDLIKYPGVRLAVTAEEQKMSKPAATLHKSAYASNGEDNHGH
ncbi:MAG TPA: gluconate 2-dehydrogenase subunit 3 family protein [Bryobacteraceae bacterium]|nr:gluconate 2-dehydrogenase subunit 3 family protein [Bryobacteraceae bacterium]